MPASRKLRPSRIARCGGLCIHALTRDAADCCEPDGPGERLAAAPRGAAARVARPAQAGEERRAIGRDVREVGARRTMSAAWRLAARPKRVLPDSAARPRARRSWLIRHSVWPGRDLRALQLWASASAGATAAPASGNATTTRAAVVVRRRASEARRPGVGSRRRRSASRSARAAVRRIATAKTRRNSHVTAITRITLKREPPYQESRWWPVRVLDPVYDCARGFSPARRRGLQFPQRAYWKPQCHLSGQTLLSNPDSSFRPERPLNPGEVRSSTRGAPMRPRPTSQCPLAASQPGRGLIRAPAVHRQCARRPGSCLSPFVEFVTRCEMRSRGGTGWSPAPGRSW